jgi:hypothetical protein
MTVTMSERVLGLSLCLSLVMSLGPARLLSFWCGSLEEEMLKEKEERAKEFQDRDEQLRKVDILKNLLLGAFLLQVYLDTEVSDFLYKLHEILSQAWQRDKAQAKQADSQKEIHRQEQRLHVQQQQALHAQLLAAKMSAQELLRECAVCEDEMACLLQGQEKRITFDTLVVSLAHVKAQLVDLQVDAAAHVEFRPDRHVLDIRSDSSTAIPRVLQAEHSQCESIIAKLKGDLKMADLQVGERDEKVRELESEIVYLNNIADTSAAYSADVAEARNVSATLRSLHPMPHDAPAAPAASTQPDANKSATMSSVQKTVEVKR